MLLLLCAEMILRYGFNLFLFAGATNTLTGETFALGLAQAEPSVVEGVNLSIAVLIAHGWLYVLYLIADFRLWSLMRWPFSRFITIALGGVVPLLSFFMEVKVHKDDGADFSFTARCRIDTYNELEYFHAGGILHYVLRRLAA